jgi:hypothetical protein
MNWAYRLMSLILRASEHLAEMSWKSRVRVLFSKDCERAVKFDITSYQDVYVSVNCVNDLQDKKYWLVPALPLILMDFMNIADWERAIGPSQSSGVLVGDANIRIP